MMDRLSETVSEEIQSIARKIPHACMSSVELYNANLNVIMAELLLDIREELRQIKRSQGDSKWGSKL